MSRFSFILFSALITIFVSKAPLASDFSWQKLLEFDQQSGVRAAGSANEKQSLRWLVAEYQKMGYDSNIQPFNYFLGKQKRHSANLEINIKGKSNKVILVGAHYDGIDNDSGSLGFTDNASGSAALLGIARNLKNKIPPYSIKLVHFGAEEVGLWGSKAYVNSVPSKLHNIIGMINLDTIIGGDKLYIHSAQTKPYSCRGISSVTYNSSPTLRKRLIKLSNSLMSDSSFNIHPATKAFAKGETGSWSDHSSFSCSGIPIAYIEATNFMINGHNGYDGYSQTTDSMFWTCYDTKNKTACNREKETGWGDIWHTKFDSPKALLPEYQNKLKSQLDKSVELLTHFLLL